MGWGHRQRQSCLGLPVSVHEGVACWLRTEHRCKRPTEVLPRDVQVHREFALAQARSTARDIATDPTTTAQITCNADELAFTMGDDFQPTEPALSTSVSNNTAAYADPVNGCRLVRMSSSGDGFHRTGRLCASKKTPVDAVELATATARHRAWSVGSVHDNGCPTDTPGPKRGHRAAWPVCLSHPVAGKDFHCLLVCDPCRVGDTECSREAHDMCPKGARCQVGYMKNMRQGICVYDS